MIVATAASFAGFLHGTATGDESGADSAPVSPPFSMSASEPDNAHLRPLQYFRKLRDSNPPMHPFAANTIAEWQAWRKQLRDALSEAIGLPLLPRPPLKVTRGPVDELDGYTRHALTIETAPGLFVPAFLLLPAGLSAPRPAVLVVHGHGYGMNEIVGLNEDGSARPFGEGYQHDMALQSVRAGFVTLVYDQFGFGRRRDMEFIRRFEPSNSCDQPSKVGLHFGQSMAGMRTFDAMRMIDFLAQCGEVDASRIGMVGISGGGLVTQYTAALDDRVASACISGYVNQFAPSILDLQHCIDNYIPGLGRFADSDDIACLIAPRPLLVEAGTEDRWFPIDATRQAITKLQRCYSLLKVSDRFEADIFEGEHEFQGAKAWTFLQRHLETTP